MTVLCSITASMLVDPYSIVHPLIGRYFFDPNNRVPKVTFLSHECSRYDSYFVGDSRSAILSQDDLGDVQGRRFYNLSTWADDIVSIVRRLNFLIEKGCPVSAVVVDESLDVSLDDKEKTAFSLQLSESPDVSGENRMRFYSRYFVASQALLMYFRAMARSHNVRDIYHADGHVDYLFGMADGQAFGAGCKSPQLGSGYKDVLSVKLSGYREMASLSDRHRFKTIVWIAPLNSCESRLLDDADVKDFLRQLRSIPNLAVIEGDRDSPLLSDFRYWHDYGHFRRIVFDQLVAPAVSQLLNAPATGEHRGLAK